MADMQLNASDKARFWSKVEDTAGSDDACWSWTASTDRDGYGRFRLDGKKEGAHRVAHFAETGEEPPVVMHTCDEPSCCRPAHLKGGTQKDNIDDKVQKDRQAKGASNGRAKLEEEQVRKIKRWLRKEDATQTEIARHYDVSKWTVRDIARGKTWTHVSAP